MNFLCINFIGKSLIKRDKLIHTLLQNELKIGLTVSQITQEIATAIHCKLNTVHKVL